MIFNEFLPKLSFFECEWSYQNKKSDPNLDLMSLNLDYLAVYLKDSAKNGYKFKVGVLTKGKPDNTVSSILTHSIMECL